MRLGVESPASPANTLLRQWTGPLTADLVRAPGEFGLGQVPARFKPDATTTVVCGFCSTGCGLNVHLKDGQAVNLSATSDYPVNLGMACPKGWEALTPLAAPDRATTPLLRNPATGKLEPTDWDHAMQVFTLKFKAIMDQHGPESVAFLSTGQICTEEMAFLGALWKFGMGALHCDSNTRQCMATSAVAYKQSFGFDAPPFTYADFEESDVLVFIGANPCVAHPIMWQRVLRNRRSPEIIVLDPRATETAQAATLHLPLAPKSDLALLYGVAHLLIQNGWVDREFVDAHTSGFAEFAEFVREFTPDAVAAKSGLTVGQIYRLAESVKAGKRVSFWWTMGVNQGHEATRTAQAVINLALLGGHIGKPGTGANSITGQCNAMGSRLFANVTSLLGGHDFANPEHRKKIATTLNIPESVIPTKPSLAYDQILDGIAAGKIKGLWVIATNPSHSWIGKGGDGEHSRPGCGSARPRAELGDALTNDAARMVESSRPTARARLAAPEAGALPVVTDLDSLLAQLDFLVVQDMYHTTDTALRADLVLPAAGWGEKEGTFINSERRFGLVKKVSRALGEALADFHIFRLVAHYWGCGELFREWTSPQAVFQILKRCSAGQPCDITGIEDYRHLDREGGVQWPLPKQSNQCLVISNQSGSTGTTAPDLDTNHYSLITTRERRLFADGRFFHPDARAKFLFSPPREVPEKPDAEFPFVLLTGRGTSAQWHTLTRTGKSDILRQLAPSELLLEINPADARRLRLRAGGTARVASRRGELTARVHITSTIRPGQVYLPMHDPATNRLTFPAFDPHSRQPSYKHCAVSVERVRKEAP
ncbi:MAG: molybdopterin-dependent oxidoreductase [Verrucomicrobia bacterium]|nr:molybdopterin-dependent oxidoreductase [Verrucomicrobiota bacterium]